MSGLVHAVDAPCAGGPGDEWLTDPEESGDVTCPVCRTPSTGVIVFRCLECGQTWTVADDPNGWAYGHDCEA